MSRNLPKKEPKRVLMVSEYYPPHWTGLSTSFHFLANQLAGEGHSVHVLTTRFDEKTLRAEQDGRVLITRVPYQIKISRTHYSIAIVWEFLKMVKDVDSVIVNSPNSNILLFAVLAKLFGKKLTIYHQADILLPKQTGNQLVHFLIDRIFDISTIPAVLLADRISTFTYDYAKFSRVLRYGLKKFFAYIPNVKLSSEAPSKDFRATMDTLAQKHMLIGISGRFVEEKGFDILFQALPLILKRYPHAHIAFAGKKVIEYEPFYDHHKELFEKYEKNVSFMGFLQGGNLAYFYEKLDVFVLSSRIECFALTQIDTLQKKVPIVVTDVSGARMLVKESGFGEIAERENPESLAEAIIEVLKNRPKYLKNHQKAVEFLEKYREFPLL